MSKIFHQPIRMCLSCRERDKQEKLYRLQCLEGKLIRFSGYGRTFYMCKNCLYQEKKAIKAIMRECKSGDRDKFTNKLKEIIADDRES